MPAQSWISLASGASPRARLPELARHRVRLPAVAAQPDPVVGVGVRGSFLRKLLKSEQYVPRVLVTDKLRS
jgi:hypothetical protein